MCVYVCVIISSTIINFMETFIEYIHRCFGNKNANIRKYVNALALGTDIYFSKVNMF